MAGWLSMAGGNEGAGSQNSTAIPSMRFARFRRLAMHGVWIGLLIWIAANIGSMLQLQAAINATESSKADEFIGQTWMESPEAGAWSIGGLQWSVAVQQESLANVTGEELQNVSSTQIDAWLDRPLIQTEPSHVECSDDEVHVIAFIQSSFEERRTVQGVTIFGWDQVGLRVRAFLCQRNGSTRIVGARIAYGDIDETWSVIEVAPLAADKHLTQTGLMPLVDGSNRLASRRSDSGEIQAEVLEFTHGIADAISKWRSAGFNVESISTMDSPEVRYRCWRDQEQRHVVVLEDSEHVHTTMILRLKPPAP